MGTKKSDGFDYRHAYDIVFKWITNVFTGKTLDVLGIKTGKITEVENLEPITIEAKQERVDILLKDDTGHFYHLEEERRLDRGDIFRFAHQHFRAIQQVKSQKLTTVLVISSRTTPLTAIKTPSASFTPMIIDLSDRDGEKKLAEIKEKETVDPVELVFLPMYGTQNKEPADFALEVVLHAQKLFNQKKIKLEFLGALIVICNQVIPHKILRAIWEEIKMLQVFKDIEAIATKEARKEFNQEIVTEMLKKEMDLNLIAEITKLSKKKVLEIKKKFEAEKK